MRVMNQISKPLLDILQKRKPSRVPFWLMRQAGRYLPEYRAIRKDTKHFLDMVYNPQKAAEITLQPIRRFGMDGAILFSDILVIPDALGQPVTFQEGEGPKLTPLISDQDVKLLNLDRVDGHCAPVFETVSRVKAGLMAENFLQTSLIGFCGSPWTVACYMIEGGGSRDFEKARAWSYSNRKSFERLMDVLVEASIRYLSGQVRAGAEIVQLFDSWAGILDRQSFLDWVITPTKKIIATLKKEHPTIPIIGFPRGAGVFLQSYAGETGIDGLGLDYGVDCAWAARTLPSDIILQGNLDPLRLLTGGDTLFNEMENIYNSLAPRGFIFNLGHGVIKQTPVDHVSRLTD